MLVELPRPALADRDDLESLSADEQRAYVRSLEREGTALRSALGARGVELRDAVSFGRTWDGFAATVDTSDLASLLEPRRARAAGAALLSGDERADPGAERAEAARDRRLARQDADRDPRHGRGAPQGAPGYDALDRDADPSPGADVAHAVAAGDDRRPRWRRSSRRRGSACSRSASPATAPTRQEIHGTTDTLLAGLERAVDPDGDGAVDDAVRVALVGVNAPYAGLRRLGRGPGGARRGQARHARRRARRQRGRRRGRPTASSARPAPPARRSRRGRRRPAPASRASTVTIGGRELQRRGGPRRRAAVGHARRSPARSRAPTPPRCCAAASEPRRDRVALVRAGTNPAAQAAAAAGAGASAVLLADPARPPAADAARRPRRRARDRADRRRREGRPGEAKAGAKVSFGKVTLDRAKAGQRRAEPRRSPRAGPAFDGSPKPDAPRRGRGVTSAGLVTGTAVAAARVAVRAARLARQRPAETPAGLREALVPQAADEARGAPPAPAVPLGPLELIAQRRRGRRRALRARRLRPRRPARGRSAIQPAARLELELRRRGGRRPAALTPPDGARDLLPAEYAYRLPASRAEGARRRRVPLPRDRPRAPSRPAADPPLARLRGPMRTVTLYTRPGCHLCDDARAALRRVQQASPSRSTRSTSSATTPCTAPTSSGSR